MAIQADVTERGSDELPLEHASQLPGHLMEPPVTVVDRCCDTKRISDLRQLPECMAVSSWCTKRHLSPHKTPPTACYIDTSEEQNCRLPFVHRMFSIHQAGPWSTQTKTLGNTSRTWSAMPGGLRDESRSGAGGGKGTLPHTFSVRKKTPTPLSGVAQIHFPVLKTFKQIDRCGSDTGMLVELLTPTRG